MFKSMLPMARVEKNQCFDQWCRRQRWKQTNVLINGAEGNGIMESQCFSKKKDGHKKSKTTQAEKGINKVKFLCNKKHLTTSTIMFFETPKSTVGKKVPYFVLLYLLCVAEKKEATLLANRSQRSR
jgi:hypothetical protein